MNRTGGADEGAPGWVLAQTIAGRLGLGVGEGAGVEGVGVGVGPATVPTGDRRLSGFATTSTPTRRTAITTAATAAIQYEPEVAGALVSEDRTRSRSAGLGEPLIWSIASFTWRRKFSLDISEHLFLGQVGSHPPGCAIDPRLGGGRRDMKNAGDLLERQVEVEMQNERQSLVRRQLEHGLAKVIRGTAKLRIWPGLYLGHLQHAPPALPARHPALVVHDRQEPGAKRAHLAAELAQLSPRLDRGLLDGVLGGSAIRQHHGGQAVRGIEQRVDQAREGVGVTRSGAQHELGSLFHQRCG